MLVCKLWGNSAQEVVINPTHVTYAHPTRHSPPCVRVYVVGRDKAIEIAAEWDDFKNEIVN